MPSGSDSGREATFNYGWLLRAGMSSRFDRARLGSRPLFSISRQTWLRGTPSAAETL